MDTTQLKIPEAPSSIQKGVPLKRVLDKEVVNQLGANLTLVHPPFQTKAFVKECMEGIEPLSLTERGKYIAVILRKYLPATYSEAVAILLKSLTPPLEATEGNGLAPMFYMPHCNFIATYGLHAEDNNGEDPFDISMQAQYEFTKRFTCEFSIRSFINKEQDRTLAILYKWMHDPNPHVRRLCSEGTRPRLPWATKIDAFVKDPAPAIKILEQLKNDPDLYVRRSVANHVGDIAKDHMELALELCENWLEGASKELKWVIRHALRNPHKKGNEKAIALRKRAS